jgi:hypothetical protein
MKTETLRKFNKDQLIYTIQSKDKEIERLQQENDLLRDDMDSFDHIPKVIESPDQLPRHLADELYRLMAIEEDYNNNLKDNYEACPSCGGEGQFPDMGADDTPFGSIKCQNCDGSGVILINYKKKYNDLIEKAKAAYSDKRKYLETMYKDPSIRDQIELLEKLFGEQLKEEK